MIEHLTATPQNKRQLAEKTGWTTRDVELAVQQARLEGAPILSNSDGYWLSSDPAAIRACAERLRARAMTQLATAGALKKAADKLPLTLWADAA